MKTQTNKSNSSEEKIEKKKVQNEELVLNMENQVSEIKMDEEFEIEPKRLTLLLILKL